MTNTNTFGPPGVTNDSSQGYAPGSTWSDIGTGRTYVCTSAAVGAAVWVQISTDASTRIIQVNPEGNMRISGGEEIEILSAILAELRCLRLMVGEETGLELEPEEIDL